MRGAALIALALLSACGDDLSREEKAERDAREVAEVEAINSAKPPARPIQPQVIGYPVIEKYELFGAGCAFAPGQSVRAVIVAMDDTAYILVNDEIERMAADMGSPEMPLATRAKYDGKNYSVTLEFDPEAGSQSGIETINYPGRAIIRDKTDQVVFEENGTVQCGS